MITGGLSYTPRGNLGFILNMMKNYKTIFKYLGFKPTALIPVREDREGWREEGQAGGDSGSEQCGAGGRHSVWTRAGRTATGCAEGLGMGVREKGIKDVAPHCQLDCLEGRQMAHGI